MSIYHYNFPTKINFGIGSIGLLPSALAAAGKKRPLIVTDRDLAPLPPVADTAKQLRGAGLAVAVGLTATVVPLYRGVRAFNRLEFY